MEPTPEQIRLTIVDQAIRGMSLSPPNVLSARDVPAFTKWYDAISEKVFVPSPTKE